MGLRVLLVSLALSVLATPSFGWEVSSRFDESVEADKEVLDHFVSQHGYKEEIPLEGGGSVQNPVSKAQFADSILKSFVYQSSESHYMKEELDSQKGRIKQEFFDRNKPA